MESLCKLVLACVVVLLVAFVEYARGDAMVTGTVICDQCKDGQRSLFDYPLSGMKVALTCGGSQVMKEETTNLFGSYTMRFDGTPDLSNCYAQLSGSEGSTSCGAAAGPAQQLKLMFSIFNMEMYAVDSLLSQPAQPMSFCPKSKPIPGPGQGQPTPVVAPPNPPIFRPPPVSLPPPTPFFRIPPIVRPPPISTPTPIPFFGASACPYKIWTQPENRCHWSMVGPDTKVAVAFGLIAARRYGTDMTLWEGLHGRGDTYRTLLREGTTALLNSYNSIQFKYPTLIVIAHMNWALMGTQQHALLTAWRFLQANSGHGTMKCNLTPCKG